MVKYPDDPPPQPALDIIQPRTPIRPDPGIRPDLDPIKIAREQRDNAEFWMDQAILLYCKLHRLHFKLRYDEIRRRLQDEERPKWERMRGRMKA